MGTLRLILALSVVMTHGLTTFGGIPLLHGAGAVWVFFTISGFLISVALSTKYADGRVPQFYWNRVIRLYPAYWTWLAIITAAYIVLPPEWLQFQAVRVDGSFQASGFWADHASSASAGTLAVASIANVTGLFADSLLTLGIDKASGQLAPLASAPLWAMGFVFIGQFWSIGVELCFYALAPLVTRAVWAMAALGLLSVTGLLERWWVAMAGWLHLPLSVVMLRAPGVLWLFMIGALLGQVYVRLRRGEGWRAVRVHLAAIAAIYVAIAVRGTALFYIQVFPWWLYALLTLPLPLLFWKTADNRFDRFAGDLSYPVYINHFILIQVLGTVVGRSGLLFAGAAILCAIPTVLWIERPASRLKFGARRSAAAPDGRALVPHPAASSS